MAMVKRGRYSGKPPRAEDLLRVKRAVRLAELGMAFMGNLAQFNIAWHGHNPLEMDLYLTGIIRCFDRRLLPRISIIHLSRVPCEDGECESALLQVVRPHPLHRVNLRMVGEAIFRRSLFEGK